MLDRVTGMQVFARVAALGSLSAAARALGMSQTMATKHVAALEDRLGVRLLHRTTRRVSLTEAGRRYLEAVERILADIEEADSAAAIDRFQVRGMLRLNAPVSFGVRELSPLLPAFAERHPDLTIELGLNDRIVDLIEEGWDMALRIGDLASSTLVARRLAACRMVVCAAPAYLATRGAPRSVDDLRQHDCLGYTLSRSLPPDRWSFGAGGARVVTVNATLRANNGDALVAAAIAGQGLVYQPSFLVSREIRDGLLVPVSLDLEPVELGGVYAVYPPGRRPAAKVRAMIDFLAERFRPTPPWEQRLDPGDAASASAKA